MDFKRKGAPQAVYVQPARDFNSEMRVKPRKALWNQQRLKRRLEHSFRVVKQLPFHLASQPGITADSRIEQNGKDCLSYLISICSLQEERGFPMIIQSNNVLSGTVLSGHPLLSGQFLNSRKIFPFMYCHFDLY